MRRQIQRAIEREPPTERSPARTSIVIASFLFAGALLVVGCLILRTTKADSATQVGAEQAGKEPPRGMVWIPGGKFTMGTNDLRSFPNERPAHKVQVEGFWIDEHDVTNAEFAEFVEATGYVTTAEKNRTGRN